MANLVAKITLVVAMALCAMPHFSYSQTQCNTTLLEAMRGTPELELLVAVIDASGLSDQLNNSSNVTVLAPDNAAFNGTDGLLDLIAADNLTLAQITSIGNNRAASIVLYHIVPTQAATADELTNRQSLPTALGTGYSLTVHKTNVPLEISFIGEGSNATVIAADNIQVCDSVVHILDRVLLPAPTLNATPVYNDTTSANGHGHDEDGNNPDVVTNSLASAAPFNSLGSGSLVLSLAGAVATVVMM